VTSELSGQNEGGGTARGGFTTPLQLSTSRPRPGVTVVAISGELDLTTAGRVTDSLRAQDVRGDTRHLVLDVTRVSFLSSQGVAMIVNTDEESATRQVHLVGVADNRRVRRVLELTGVAPMFASYSTVDEVLASLDAADEG
jgi:anti-sigma B factor antagonist